MEMNDEIKLETLETDGGSLQDEILNTQEQSAAPDFPEESNNIDATVETPVASDFPGHTNDALDSDTADTHEVSGEDVEYVRDADNPDMESTGKESGAKTESSGEGSTLPSNSFSSTSEEKSAEKESDEAIPGDEKPRPEYEIDVHNGKLILNGIENGRGVSGSLISRALRAYAKEAVDAEGRPIPLESIVLSEDVKVITADAFSALENSQGVRYGTLSLISENGRYTVLTENGVASPFVAAAKHVKAIVFNERIPSGLTEKRDGRNAVKGILEGCGPAVVMTVNVKDIPERAFARSRVSVIAMNGHGDTLTVGSEAFSMRMKGLGDKAEYQPVTKGTSLRLSTKEQEDIRKVMHEFFVSTEVKGKAKAERLKGLEAQEKMRKTKAEENGEHETATLCANRISAIIKERKAVERQVSFVSDMSQSGELDKFGDTLRKTAEYGRDGNCSVAFPNISSDIHDGAFSGRPDLRFIYAGGEPDLELGARGIEMEKMISSYLDRVVPSAGPEARMNLARAVSEDLERSSSGLGLLEPKEGRELVKVLEKAGADKESIASARGLYASMAARCALDRKYREASEKGRLFMTCYGTSIGRRSFFGTAFKAVLQAKGTTASQRVMTDHAKAEREYQVARAKFEAGVYSTPKEADEAAADLKRREAQLAEEPARLANVSMKDEALSGMEDLGASNLEYDGVARNIYRGSGSRSAGITSEKKDEQGNNVVGRLTGLEDKETEERWKPTPMEVIASYHKAWSVARKMSLLDQFFDIAKNLLIIGTAGLVVGIKAVPGLAEKAGRQISSEKTFDQPVKLSVRDDVADLDISLTSSAAWENYGRLRATYRDAQADLGRKETLQALLGDRPEENLVRNILVTLGEKEESLKGKSLKANLEHLGTMCEKTPELLNQVRKEVSRDLTEKYMEAARTLIVSGYDTRTREMKPIDGSFREMVDEIMNGAAINTGIPLFPFSMNKDGRQVSGEAVFVNREGRRYIDLRGMVDAEGKPLTVDAKGLRKISDDFRSASDMLKAYGSNLRGDNLPDGGSEAVRKGVIAELEKCLGKAVADDFRKVTGQDKSGRNTQDIADARKVIDDYTAVLEKYGRIVTDLAVCAEGNSPELLAKLENRSLEGTAGKVMETLGSKRDDGTVAIRPDAYFGALRELMITGNIIFGETLFADGNTYRRKDAAGRAGEKGSLLERLDLNRFEKGEIVSGRGSGKERDTKGNNAGHYYGYGQDDGRSR